jgi:lycopene beta-cyclase
MENATYDIIISGGGFAGLSLLYRAMKDGLWTDKTILVVDVSLKQQNDKTWSFWKKEESVFDEVIFKQWTELSFFGAGGRKVVLDPGEYNYNSIRSIDFYTYVLEYLRPLPNITFVQEEIVDWDSAGNECTLITKDHQYRCTYLFNSVYKQPEPVPGIQYFLQHFKGWRIKTNSWLPPVDEAYLMDFRTTQEHGTSFFYTLPLSASEIFVEYTIFSKEVLTMEEYESAIKIYLDKVLRIKDYVILEEEYGVIPMTDHPFKRFEGNIVHIGTAGGDTRASTGYTFTNTQKTISNILTAFKLKGTPFFKKEAVSYKHRLYDSTMLNVLDSGEYAGFLLFADLFYRCPAPYIFAFLDAETSIFQDIHIMRSLMVAPFLKEFSRAVHRRVF